MTGPNGDARYFLRHPTVVVFALGLVGAIFAWAVRQEVINNKQQQQIDMMAHTLTGRIGPVELGSRLGNLEGRLDTLEKLLHQRP